MMDWGAKIAVYHSDLTRTFFWGKLYTLMRQIHAVVQEEQRVVIAQIAPGVELSAVDKAAHDAIDKAGYGRHFSHSTGHGIGLEVHEEPTLSDHARGWLREGMVVTVEPGVYLPGVAGIRVEDVVLVTKTGCKVLSRLKSGLRWDGSE